MDIEYEFSFISLSSSRRDEDLNSEFDKFESFLNKADTALLVQAQTASDDAMNQIKLMYGPFDPDEIQYYKHRLSDGAKCTVNAFQRDLVFNLFFKYFGDLRKFPCIGIYRENNNYLIAGNSRERQSAAKSSIGGLKI